MDIIKYSFMILIVILLFQNYQSQEDILFSGSLRSDETGKRFHTLGFSLSPCLFQSLRIIVKKIIKSILKISSAIICVFGIASKVMYQVDDHINLNCCNFVWSLCRLVSKNPYPSSPAAEMADTKKLDLGTEASPNAGCFEKPLAPGGEFQPKVAANLA